LSKITARGLSQSILSAAEQELLRGQVSHFEITHHFAHMRGIDNHRAESKLELGRALLAELDLPQRDILMVGDTLHDADVARALGFDAVLIEGGHQSRARLATATVPVLDSLEALLSD
jgi:phosphoglycolate phosphatase